MCGRFVRYTPAEHYAAMLDLPEQPGLLMGYNITPGRNVLCARRDPAYGAVLDHANWGFVPSWATDRKLSPINARAETAATKTMFRRAFERRRCLIPADAWYEWQQTGGGKQPYAIAPEHRQPFCFAGLWSQTKSLPSDQGGAMRTVAILTTAAADDIHCIHDRMPVALTESGARDWLTPHHDTERAQQVLTHDRCQHYVAWPVSTRVNSPKNDDEGLLERA